MNILARSAITRNVCPSRLAVANVQYTAKWAQADALEIEAQAKRRIANEYDAAQERGEVASGRPKSIPGGNTSATVADIGISSKDIHDVNAATP